MLLRLQSRRRTCDQPGQAHSEKTQKVCRGVERPKTPDVERLLRVRGTGGLPMSASLGRRVTAIAHVVHRYRMAYKAAVVIRPLAIVVIAATLGLPSPGGLLFRCRFDGVVRTACCCEHQRNTHQHPAMSQAVAGNCCDLLVRSPVTREAMKVDPPARPADIQLVLLPTPPLWPAFAVTASTLQASFTGPPRLGGSLFLQSCSLLI